MSYCRWLGGDLYAYKAPHDYVGMVAARYANDQVKAIYNEPNAHALLARMLWLGSKGCDYPWDAYRYLKEDTIEEIEAMESRADDPEAT